MISGVADRRGERLGTLVWLDSSPVPDGMAVVDALSPEQRARQECDVRERGDGWRWPVVDAVAWVTQDLRAGVWIGHGDDAVLEARDVIRDLAAKYTVVEIAFDPWRAGQLAAELEREGIACIAFPQSDSRMIPASARLHAAIVEKRIILPDHDELAQHAANTIARQSRRGWRIDKPDDRTANDGIIALCMAVDAAENRPEPVRLLGWL